jgi:hypothetical protein
MDWAQVLTVFAVIAINLGTIIALYIQMDKKMDEHRKDTMNFFNSIQIEMRDFHGRLCAIEERNKK